jgi:hypothetical protein
MAAIGMITEEDATGKPKKIYSEIMENLGIDFVPICKRADMKGGSDGH